MPQHVHQNSLALILLGCASSPKVEKEIQLSGQSLLPVFGDRQPKPKQPCRKDKDTKWVVTHQMKICQVQQELLACNCLLSVIQKRTDQGQSACGYTSVHEEHCCYCQQALGKWRTESAAEVQTSECVANRYLEHNTISCHILKIGEGV